MNLHAEKTEVLLELCKKHNLDLSAKPSRAEMLKKLTEMEDPLLGEEPTLEEETDKPDKPEVKPQAKKGKQNKGFAQYKQFKLEVMARGSEKAKKGLDVDLSIPYGYDEDGDANRFVHCRKATHVKTTSMTHEQVQVLNAHAHTTLVYYEAVGA
jgi:hypothetical protein